jgi:hypothetical protein
MDVTVMLHKFMAADQESRTKNQDKKKITNQRGDGDKPARTKRTNRWNKK